MERQRVPRAGKAPRKRRRESPLPGAAALPGRRAGPPQPCRRSLFGRAGPRGPEPGCPKKKVSGKTLPKIKENLELIEESPSCNQSNQVNVRETRDLEKEEEESEESSVSLKKSSMISFESKESLQNAEMTSSTGMTLPTGVSTFLIECLDADSTADFNNTSDSLQSYSSPETFRDDDSERSHFYSVDLGKYKNSTLLDSSKAVTIDKIAQISNLSAILEPVPKDFQGQCIRRKRPSNCNYSSSALGISATLSGKKLCKITAARERTPDLKSGMRCASPLGPDSKPGKQTAKPKRLKRKGTENNSNLAEEGSSSFRQLDAPGNTSAKSGGLTAEVVPTKPTDAVVQMTSTMLMIEENKALKNPGNAQLAQLKLSLSPVCKASPGESLFLNTTGPCVNSEEIVPASLSSEKEIIPQSPEEKNIFKPLCDRQEICSIVRLSPHQRPSRLQQVPVIRKGFSLPKGVPEDTITCTKNWICCEQR
ncbi:meiosis-specific kinetochore protein isoform X1 [Neopelma chrysocephalum]|uniref:meiosis-specific kinetochore protein isoform X1 n=3 Tax=Neopelma chrysocephalum TaxID=114329 RepID=UPI000FCD157E|nr:meiosis-specific kinetochore protein isoform X1 [Neopelma chrysocephalum]